MTTDPPRRSYRPIVLGTLAGLLVAIFAAVLIVLINRGDSTPPPVAGPEGCGTNRNQVRIEFEGADPDTPMLAAADRLRQDKQVVAIRTQTRPQAFEEFQRVFKDQPDLLKIARPEALPASIWLVTAHDTKPADLATRLQTDLPAAKINPDPCAYPV
jgi:hypothetical protein